MTCGQSNFAAFHWLPEEDPANIIEISSDDEKEIAQTALPHPEQVETTPEDPEPSAAAAAEAKAKAAAFRRTIRTSIPIHFLNDPVRLRIRAAAICMLETAMSSGTTLDAVYIDDNCLPAWPGRVWDPEDQSLHEVIQSRLAECLDTQELGRSLSAAIIEIGNWRLQEAVALGLQLQDLTIGENLLPTWPDRDVGNSPSSSSSSSSDGDAAASDNETMMEIGSSVHSNKLPPPPQPTSQAVAHQRHPTSAWSSDTDSTYESESERPVSDYDDEVSLFNFVSRNPTADDEGDADAPLSNVVHGVDVYGGPPFREGAPGDPIDFEVYAAVDDPDVEQLPEAELLIDEEAFAHHHHLADVVEIELADSGIYCVVPSEIRSADGAELLEAPGEAEQAHSLKEVITVPSEGEAQASADWVVI